jgi:hypothetical protein
LTARPAWIFAADEVGRPDQDEATVRPYTPRPIDPGDGLLVVRAIFRLADGTELTGYVSPIPSGEPPTLGAVQPVILGPSGQIPLWFGMAPLPPERVAGLLAALGRSARQVFPLRYRSDVPLADRPIEGQVEGFGYLARGRVAWTRS